MWWLLILLVIVAGAALYIRSNARASSAPHAQARREVEAEIGRQMPQVEGRIEREAAKMLAELDRQHPRQPFREPEADPKPPPARGRHGGPSWMSEEEWASRVVAYRRQGRSPSAIAEVAAYLEKRGPGRPRELPKGQRVPRRPDGGVSGSGKGGMVYREDFVPKQDEARHLTRDSNGLPTLRLVDAGDRLAIWSPIDGGHLINPKGPGLRSLGLCASYARGVHYHESTFRTADLRKGRWVDLKREPENPHDKNAVAMYAPGARSAFAYVQKGRAPSVARRMDAGEDMAGVTIWGPGRGKDDRSSLVLIGSRADLIAMLDS